MFFLSATAWFPMLGLLLLGGATNAAGRSLQGPTLSSLISKFADRKEQGVTFGLYHGLGSLARVIGPVIAGFMYRKHVTGAFVTAAGIVIVASAWTILVRASAAATREQVAPVTT
jgi:MFS family permease